MHKRAMKARSLCPRLFLRDRIAPVPSRESSPGCIGRHNSNRCASCDPSAGEQPPPIPAPHPMPDLRRLLAVVAAGCRAQQQPLHSPDMAAISSDSDLGEVPQQPATPSAGAPGGRRPPAPGAAPPTALRRRAPALSATTAVTSAPATDRGRSGTPETAAAGDAGRAAGVTPGALRSALQGAILHNASQQGAHHHDQQQQQQRQQQRQQRSAERTAQLRQPGRLQDAQRAGVQGAAGGMEWPESPPSKRKLAAPAADQRPGGSASAAKRLRVAPPQRPWVADAAAQARPLLHAVL